MREHILSVVFVGANRVAGEVEDPHRRNLPQVLHTFQRRDLIVADREGTELLHGLQALQLGNQVVEKRQVGQFCKRAQPFDLLDIIERKVCTATSGACVISPDQNTKTRKQGNERTEPLQVDEMVQVLNLPDLVVVQLQLHELV